MREPSSLTFKLGKATGWVPGFAGMTKFEKTPIPSPNHPKDSPVMTNFADKERAEEAKFARDEEMQFRVAARRNRLLGGWAAEKMGLTAAEADAYGKEVIQADFEEAGDEDVIRKVLGDLTAAGIEIDEAEIRAALTAKSVEARRALMGEA